MSDIHVIDDHVIIIDRRGSKTGVVKLLQEVRLIADKHFFGNRNAKLCVVYHMETMGEGYKKLFVCSTRRMNDFQTQPHARIYVHAHPLQNSQQ